MLQGKLRGGRNSPPVFRIDGESVVADGEHTGKILNMQKLIHHHSAPRAGFGAGTAPKLPRTITF